jgi:hypothetical protein
LIDSLNNDQVRRCLIGLAAFLFGIAETVPFENHIRV